jgi:hypothetical protein
MPSMVFPKVIKRVKLKLKGPGGTSGRISRCCRPAQGWIVDNNYRQGVAMDEKIQTRKGTPELRATIHLFLETQVQGVLATMCDGRPYQHLMAYAVDASLQSIYVASLRDTEKVKNMLRTPSVSLFWDNRTGSIEDHTEGLALTATGQAELLDNEERDIGFHGLLLRNATLAGLLSNAEVAIFAIRVSRYSLALGYTSKQEYVPTDR